MDIIFQKHHTIKYVSTFEGDVILNGCEQLYARSSFEFPIQGNHPVSMSYKEMI